MEFKNIDFSAMSILKSSNMSDIEFSDPETLIRIFKDYPEEKKQSIYKNIESTIKTENKNLLPFIHYLLNHNDSLEAINTYPKMEFWANLSGLSIEEIEKMPLADFLKLVKKYKNTNKISTDSISLKSILPNTFIIPNNKMANQMVNDLLGAGEVALSVCGNKKEVLTKVSVNYDDEGIQIYNEKKFTPYDRVVCDSVTSLFESGNSEFSPTMVYRCMNGLKNTEKISPQAVAAVTKSIDKISRMYCKIDWTFEAKRQNSNVDETVISGNILATEKITVKSGGKTLQAYKLLSKPILYRYAQSINQVISVPIKLLQTKEATRSTEDVIVIREYLIRRIEMMKNPKNNMTNRIKYKSIFEDLELLEPTKQKSEKIRTAVKELLNYWKKEKYIKGFIEYKEGKTLKGIDVSY